jgi:dTDP-4-dehydrorhamnose reductase
MKIVIIGASGFLGTKLTNLLSKENEIIGASLNPVDKKIKSLDATDEKKVFEFLKEQNPEVVIDLVALTSSVACEQNPSLCKKLNFETAKNIAKACKKLNAKMIFISSSYIFDGEKGNYSEEEQSHPLNQYGKYKVLAEKEVLKLKDSLVLRTTIMYGYNGKDKPHGVFNKILSGEKISLGDPSQFRNPIFVDDVAMIISSLLDKKQRGIFHMAGSTSLTMINFLKKLEYLVRNDSKILINKDAPSLVNHPKDDTLNINKLNSLGIKTHSLDEGINLLKKQISV